MIAYAISNLPDMLNKLSAASNGIIGDAVKAAAEDSATKVEKDGDFQENEENWDNPRKREEPKKKKLRQDEDGSDEKEKATEKVIKEIVSPANMFAIGRIGGEIFANMMKQTLPNTK